MAIYVHHQNQQVGPLEETQVLAAIRTASYLPDDLAWRDGMPEWQPLRVLFPAEFTPGGPLPPPLPAMQAPRALGDDAAMRFILPVGRSGWAIAAGYLGLFALVILPAPLALLISLVAIWDIRRSRSMPHPKRGLGRAIFGLITGTLGTVILVAVLLSRHH